MLEKIIGIEDKFARLSQKYKVQNNCKFHCFYLHTIWRVWLPFDSFTATQEGQALIFHLENGSVLLTGPSKLFSTLSQNAMIKTQATPCPSSSQSPLMPSHYSQ